MHILLPFCSNVATFRTEIDLVEEHFSEEDVSKTPWLMILCLHLGRTDVLLVACKNKVKQGPWVLLI